MNDFSAFWKLGYHNLLPIIPAHVLANGGDPGKSPGLPNGDDTWHGFPGWQRHQATEAECEAWAKMGAGVGIRCENGLIAIDADTLDQAHAALIHEKIAAALGPLPERVGLAPKTLFLLRTEPGYSHPKIRWNSGEVDFRTYGQFVAAGIHKLTREPYRWVTPPVAIETLPYASPAVLDSLWGALRDELPGAHLLTARVAFGPPPPQESLRGEPAKLRRAIRAIPNDYLDRDTYIKIAIALKASYPDDVSGLELFKEWCDAWTHGHNDEEIVEKDWHSLRGKFSIGADWLYRTATARSPEICPPHWDKFEDIPEPGSIKTVKASSFEGLPVPQQKWLVKDIVPAHNVTMLAGDGATGKSLIALQLGAAVATGTPWLGVGVERGRALFFTAEDEMDELQRRIVDICRSSPFKLDALDDLNLISFNGLDAILAAPMGKEGLLKATALFDRMRKTIQALHPTLLFLDTQADLFGGDENKRIHARQFIGILQGLVNEFDITIILLSHPSLSGMSSGSGMSGNTAWNNSVRSRLYLTRRIDHEIEPDPDVRILTIKKANRARNGAKLLLRYAGGVFVREGIEDDTLAADRQSKADEIFMAILNRMALENRAVSHLETSKNFAPVMFEKNVLAAGTPASVFQASMERLFASGAIHVSEYGPPSRRHKQIAAKVPVVDLFG